MSGAGTFQSGTFQAYNKREDAAEALRSENYALKRQLHISMSENSRLKGQIAGLSVALDKAVHQGYLTSPYDVTAGQELAKQAEKAGALQHDEIKALPGEVKQRDMRQFQLWNEYEVHEQCVFCARFSPRGDLIASGSFDRTVRIHGLEFSEDTRVQLRGHTMLVSNLCWKPEESADDYSRHLVSASYDGTCKLWDVNAAKCVSTFKSASEGAGFMLSCEWAAHDGNLFFATNSTGSVYQYDRRASPMPVADVAHTCMVNTVRALPSGNLLLGDRHGEVRTWDPRMLARQIETLPAGGGPGVGPPRVIRPSIARPAEPQSVGGGGGGGGGGPLFPFETGVFKASTDERQVAHISISESGPEDMRGRFLGVTSFDDTLRIYDRNVSDVEYKEPKLISGIMGQDLRMNGVMVHSSFFVGDHCTGKPKPVEERMLDDSMLVATGSLREKPDACAALVYDITDCRRGGSSILLQKLWHKSVVYGVHFHPKMPIAMTYAADGSVRLWACQRRPLHH